MSAEANATGPVVHAPDGQVSGLQLDGNVQRFLGIPYAAPPVGPLRLRGPRPVAPWAGVRDGTRPAPASLQTLGGNQVWMNEPIARQAEDCLYLNVWTPDVNGSAPVLFWLHGGQTRNGHGAAPGIDGAALARRGLVVVTINYRLGGLGGLAHPDLVDDDTGFCANWGLQDKLAALAWVQRCIASFGGDPARVTLAGQSSGGANAVMITQHGLGRGHYARVIAQSPPLFRPPMFVDLDKAAEYTEALAQAMGVTVTGLREVDGAALQKAEHAFAYSPELAARMGRPRTAPVRDGRLLRQWPVDAPASPVPVLAGWTRSESDFWFGLRDGQGCTISPQQPPQTEAELLKRCTGLIGLHYAFAEPPAAAAVIDAYRVAGTPAQIWRDLYTDLVFRAPILQFMSRCARAGTPTWGYEFAHPIASADGGSPHATDVPFVFGTHGHPHFDGKIGDAAAMAETSASMMSAWSSFVRDGRPTLASGKTWPAFDPAQPQLAQFGVPGGARVVAVERQRGLDCWPSYR